MKNLLLFILLLTTANLMSAPFNGELKQFRQPDGSLVDVLLYGTEFYMRAEGLDNYTLVRDKTTGWICYAKLSDNGNELISTGIKYNGKQNGMTGLKEDLPVNKHLDITEESRNKIINDNKQYLLGSKINRTTDKNDKTDPFIVSGDIKGLCIVVDFSDEPGTVPISEFEDFCNDLTYSNYGNNGSIRTYFSDISGGLVNYENVVFGYYRAPRTFAYYETLDYAVGAQQILGLALNWIESNGFDFSTLSINPDGSIKAINLMYTGVAQTWSEGMWWHQGYYGDFTADGVQSGAYNCSPAYGPLTMHTACHENGHMIGNWPDTYKYDNNTGSDGIGAFDIMCTSGSMTNPVPPNPHFRSNAGWGQVIDITHFNGINTDTANSGIVYKYVNPNDTNEFFLLENRMQNGRSEAIPDEGLTIWHIDRNGNNQSFHHEVFLEHANNNINNHYTACFHAAFKDEFSDSTLPASSFYNGDASGLSVWEIGPVNDVLQYKVGAGQPAPSFSIVYQGITDDDNHNTFPEAGETISIALQAGNFGQLPSGQATITCTPEGSSADYLTVSDPEIQLDSMHVEDIADVSYSISIDSETPVGTASDLKFELTDNTYSYSISKTIEIGKQIIMDDQVLSECSAIFLDNGGSNSNYSDLTDLTTTFEPSTEGMAIKVQFLTFGMEAEDNCGYDFLKIYNGPSASSKILGTFCGNSLPKTFTSTNESGALTLVFHSDEYVNDIGWSAIVSCVAKTALQDHAGKTQLTIAPNPLTNISKIEFEPGMNQSIRIINVIGMQVFTVEFTNQSYLEVNKDDFKKGVYFVQLKQGNKIVTTEKLVVF
jgi:M6 family metalloprotease-like protein